MQKIAHLKKILRDTAKSEGRVLSHKEPNPFSLTKRDESQTDLDDPSVPTIWRPRTTQR